MQKIWRIADLFPSAFKDKFPHLPDIILQLLWQRNLDTTEKVEEFLHPDWQTHVHDPFIFRDMDKAVARIYEAKKNGETIGIFADYDSDGVCGGAVLATTFRAIGISYLTYIPHRELEGYGIKNAAIDFFKNEKVCLVITCDCGIANREQIAYAADQGIETIVTDHHTAPSDLPDRALALLHPHLPNEPYPFKDLSGGGVAFKFAQGILRRFDGELTYDGAPITKDGFEKWLLDLVAIAAVADMVPLLGESRTLVKHGLIVLNKNRRLGLQKLFLIGKINPGKLDTRSIGFQIAPRINAAGRMNHANNAFKLLMSIDPVEAEGFADELQLNNLARQKLTEKIVKEVFAVIEEHKLADQPVIYAFNPAWPLGLLGLVAGKVAEQFNRPTILFTEKEGRPAASARSVASFNLILGLQAHADYFAHFGGHPAAAGLTLKSKDVFEEFKQKFSEYAKNTLAGTDLTPVLQIDKEVNLTDITWDLYEMLEKFEPFGMKNLVPRYVARKLKVVEVKAMGQTGHHLRVLVKHNDELIKKMIGFFFGNPDRHNGVKWLEELTPGREIDMVFEVGVNEWNGHRDLELKIVDMKMV